MTDLLIARAKLLEAYASLLAQYMHMGFGACREERCSRRATTMLDFVHVCDKHNDPARWNAKFPIIDGLGYDAPDKELVHEVERLIATIREELGLPK